MLSSLPCTCELCAQCAGICMKVVECVQIVCKLQVSFTQRLTPFAIFSTGLVCWNKLFLTLPMQRKAKHFGRSKLLHRHRIQFVLEESECLVIHSDIEGMVEGVLTGIIVSCNISQTIRVREQQLQHQPNYPCP